MRQKRSSGTRGDYAIDRQLGIVTCGIEEWDEGEETYHRYESTPYRALDRLVSLYLPPEDAFVVDYGAGLGRINFYLHHQLGLGGYGLDVHPDRIRRARANLRSYNARQGCRADIRFVREAAEVHCPSVQSNLFYFFNPFAASVFEAALRGIRRSLEERERAADLILYYPDPDYLQILAHQELFEPLYLVNLPWSKDPQDYFMIYRHPWTKWRAGLAD
jgi:hypothetical protein